MSTIQSELLTDRSAQLEPDTICCYPDAEVSRWTTSRFNLSGEQLLAAQALQLLLRLDHKIREARADWNQDRFRRVMKTRSKVVTRLRRRWNRLDTLPPIGLGKLRRRYHANLARYLYEPEKPAPY